MGKIKILHIITGLDGGGAENVVFDLCRKLDEQKFAVYVISLSDENKIISRFINSNINVKVLGIKKSIRGVIFAIRFIYNFLDKENIKLIHAHMTHSIIIASILRMFKPKLKVIFTSHSFNIGSKLREYIILILKPFRDYDIVFSKSMNYFYLKNERIIIPNGIETLKYDLELKPYEKFTFLVIGRLEFVKNHIKIIECANKLKDEFDFQILFVGEGGLRSNIEERLEEYNLKNIIKLLGFRDDVATICNKSQVFLMSSHWEGLPISMLEAGASGNLVLSTDVGSINTLINENTGILCSQEDFCNQMKTILINYEILKYKGQNLKHTIKKRFDIQNFIQSHEELYTKVLIGENRL